MADSVTFTSKLAATIGSTTIAGAATSTKTLDSTSALVPGVDVTQQTLTSLCTAATFHSIWTELDMGDVWKTSSHGIQLRNTSTSTTHEPCIMVAARSGHMIITTELVIGQSYLVAGGALTNNGVVWQIGEVLIAAHADFTGAGATAELLIPIGIMFPGDPLGPIRRKAFTAAGYGALGHYIFGSAATLTCPLEISAAEVGDPTA